MTIYENEPEYYTVDFSHVETDDEFHAVLEKSLEFPEGYSRNWLAFWDFLSEMPGVPLYIDIYGLENLQKRMPLNADYLLQDMKTLKHIDDDRYADITHITIVTGDARTEIT